MSVRFSRNSHNAVFKFIALKDCYYFRMENNVYGPICADGWTQDWSDEVCVSMNYLGQVSNSEFNTSVQGSEYFVLNSTLTPNEISHVQEARSNFVDSCDAAVNFECQSFGEILHLFTLKVKVFEKIGLAQKYMFFCKNP